MMIVNGDSRVINKLEVSLTDDARVVIYDHHMFIVQATAVSIVNFWHNFETSPNNVFMRSSLG